MTILSHEKTLHQPTLSRKTFFCPEFVPTGVDDDFCLPCGCPEQLPQPKFPSPTSALSPQELEEVEECIMAANDLLLSLVTDDEINERALQLNLRRLRKQFVTVLVDCGNKKEEVSGIFLDAGKDFIILVNSETKNVTVITTNRILFFSSANRKTEAHHEQELISIDPCLRRQLTFNFGETVTKSPFLLNLFFGLDLSMFLESYVGYYCYVRTDREKQELDGTLIKIRTNSIELTKYDEKQAVDFDEICIMELEK
uniref:Uncharacterized protein n=1 Tax=Anaerobacillus isosaccharinicus TaxID=1532552 RepID=A0A1S2LZZ6_9BACI